jgi:predicted nucleotidyltransferase
MTLAMSYGSRLALPAEVQRLVDLCKNDMKASEVWLFGSRARGDFREDSDYDLLAIIPDDAPADIDTPVAAFRLRRKSKANADLLTARMTDFRSAVRTPNTISFAVASEGLRLDR